MNIIYKPMVMRVFGIKERIYIHETQNSWGYTISVGYYFN